MTDRNILARRLVVQEARKRKAKWEAKIKGLQWEVELCDAKIEDAQAGCEHEWDATKKEPRDGMVDLVQVCRNCFLVQHVSK